MTPIAPGSTVAVIGAGTMGAGIAQVAAEAGHPVLLFDARAGMAATAIAGIVGRLDRAVEKGRLTTEARAAIADRLVAGGSLSEAAPAGLVVEAILEDLAAKRQLFADLEGIVGPDCVLATNTSSLSVTAIAAGLAKPERCVGMHFFNPAPVMALVEVASGLATRPDVAEAVLAAAARWGKKPVALRTTPGFIVNRVARPFYGEAFRLLEEGAADIATIDALLRESGGFPMGPFELIDLIGNDVNFAVTTSIHQACHGDPRYSPSGIQAEMVAAGRLGRKAGRGYYDYAPGAGKPLPATASEAPPPSRVTVVGGGASGDEWAALIAAAGIAVDRLGGAGGELTLRLDHIDLVPTDGRLATERAAESGRPVVLFDLARDYRAARRLAVAAADQAAPDTLAPAVGLIQACGKAVSVVDDSPGLVVMRSVAMIANGAADLVQRRIATAAAIDSAMRDGANYPAGPLAWAEAIGLPRILAVIDNLARFYGEDRYRAAPLLRRRVLAGAASFSAASQAP